MRTIVKLLLLSVVVLIVVLLIAFKFAKAIDNLVHKPTIDSLHIVDSIYKADSVKFSYNLTQLKHRTDSLDKRCKDYKKTIQFMRLQHGKEIRTLEMLNAPDSVIVRQKLSNCIEENVTLSDCVDSLSKAKDLRDTMIAQQAGMIAKCDSGRMYNLNKAQEYKAQVDKDQETIKRLKKHRRVLAGTSGGLAILAMLLIL